MVPIREQELQLKSKAETPAHCETQVRKIVGDIKISNKKYKAGNIASCLSTWKEVTCDKWVLSTVSGANIEFEDITQIPLAQRKPQKHERDSHLYRHEIENLLKKGAIVPVADEERGYISTIFLREKKDNKYRLILNIKNFNRHVTYRRFKTDNLKTVLTMVRKDCYMSSIDLSNEYYSIPVAICDQKYIIIQFTGQLCKFVCLPNGLTSAPTLFTEILKPVFIALHKEGHDIMGYLDDSILLGNNYDECKVAVLRAVTLFQSLGFQVHPEKSSLTPKQEIDFLGFTTNSKNMTLKLTKQKCNKILKHLDLTLKHANNITIREFSKILGMLEAAIHGVKYGRLHLFYSIKCKNQALTLSKGSYDCYFKLSSGSIVEINW